MRYVMILAGIIMLTGCEESPEAEARHERDNRLGVVRTYGRGVYDYSVIYDRIATALEKQNELMKEFIELNKQK